MAGSTPEGAASVQRLPEKATLGLEGREVAGGMYQCQTTLERAAGAIFMDFVTAKARKIASSSPFRMETLLAAVSVGVQSPGAEARGMRPDVPADGNPANTNTMTRSRNEGRQRGSRRPRPASRGRRRFQSPSARP